MPNCPVLVCDLCGERLVDAGKAAVVFNNFAANNSKIKAFHVHKGTIDGKTCHQEADTLIRAAGGTPGWQEMKRSLTDLVANSDFPADKMAEYAKRPGY
jgi:hypothetical protein